MVTSVMLPGMMQRIVSPDAPTGQAQKVKHFACQLSGH
jgi:hypothetical protein